MRTVVALGYFDSLHLGHLKIIERAKAMAKNMNARVEVSTFDDNFLRIIKKSPAVYLIEERRQILKENGIDDFIVIKTDQGFYNLSGQGFFYLFVNQNVAGVVCGADYRFGKGGQCTSEDLQMLCRSNGIACEVVDIVSIKEQKISSSAIKLYLKNGEMDKANQMLGRNYSVSGKVIRGEGRGKEIGFPTVNLDVDMELKQLPMQGVYKTRTIVDNSCFESLTNVGFKPTFSIYKPTIETYIIDFNRNIYGKTIKIEFLSKIRDIIKFDSPAKLEQQIQKDLQAL